MLNTFEIQAHNARLKKLATPPPGGTLEWTRRRGVSEGAVVARWYSFTIHILDVTGAMKRWIVRFTSEVTPWTATQDGISDTLANAQQDARNAASVLVLQAAEIRERLARCHNAGKLPEGWR